MPCRSLPQLAPSVCRCEMLEARRLLAASVQYVPQAPDGTVLPPVTFTEDLSSSGALVQQFTANQHALLPTNFASSNYDLFLRLDGVAGDATAVGHVGEVSLLSFNWVQNGGAVSSGSGSGGKPQISALHFVTRVSKASPTLMSLVNNGSPIPTGVLTVQRRGPSPLEFYRIDLENVQLSSYQVKSGDLPEEEFTLVFRKATITYTTQRPDGSAGSQVQSQIDVAASGAGVLPFQPVQTSLLDGPITPPAGSEFLRLDGIPGEAMAVGHIGQISLNSFGFDLQGSVGSGSGTGGGKPSYSSIHVVAPFSIATPKLMLATASGQIIPTADLSVLSSTGTDIYDIHLSHVIVTSYRATSTNSSSGPRPSEEFTLSFAKIVVQYNFQTSAGPTQTVQFEADAPALLADSMPPQVSVLDSFFQPPTESMYVRLDGVTGGTTVAGQSNELPALAFNWGEQGASTSGGIVTGRTSFQDLHIVTLVSAASPQIEALVASDQIVPTADFIILTPEMPSPFYRIHLEEVQVTSYHLSTARDGGLEEEFTLAFTKVTVDDTAQSPAGVVNTPVEFQEDLTAHGDLHADFTATQQALLNDNFTPDAAGTLLTIAGIRGDSTVAGHPGAIDILAFASGVTSPRDPSSGQATGKGEFQPLHFVSRVSSASPALMHALATGQALASADLLVPCPTPTNCYMVHLDNVYVVSYQTRIGPDGAMDEEFALAYSKLTVTYVPQDPAGPGTPVVFSEDLQAGGDTILGFAPPPQSLFTPPGPASSPAPLQPPSPTQSADDLFLTIAGVSGPSTDARHIGSIPLVSWGWGADLPLGAIAGGVVLGKPAFQALHFVSAVSQASPKLMQLEATDQNISTVELDIRHPGAASDYFILRLTDARVSSYQVKQGNSLLEEFTLNFAKVEVDTPLNSGVMASFTEDLAATGAAFNDFTMTQQSLLNGGFQLSRQSMFLNLAGIPGDSTDFAHPRQIVVDSFDWGESGNGPVVFDELHVVAPLSSASPLIVQAVLSGHVIPTADLFVRKGGAKPFDYYTIHLDNAQITSDQIATGPDGSEVEEFTLHFSGGGGTGSISGRVFNDANHNGALDPGESGLAGVTVFLDLQGDGKLDPADPTAITDASGAYTFTGLHAGTYTVRQVLPGGYAATAPLGYSGMVAVSAGQTATGPIFGDVQVSTVTMDFAYLVLLARHYGQPATFADGDLNGDGAVGFDDLVLLARNYNHTLPALAAAPAVSGLATLGPSLTVAQAGHRRHPGVSPRMNTDEHG